MTGAVAPSRAQDGGDSGAEERGQQRVAAIDRGRPAPPAQPTRKPWRTVVSDDQDGNGATGMATPSAGHQSSYDDIGHADDPSSYIDSCQYRRR
jgi:hypothetical protein